MKRFALSMEALYHERMSSGIMAKKRMHIVGIGGIGLSALAQLLKTQGHEISGCDRAASPITKKLQAEGFGIHIGHSAAHISKDIDLVVYSDAVAEGSDGYVERKRARELGIKEQSYAEALGAVANQSNCLIAVAGAHGKTSTTAMLIDVLEAAGLDPTAIVGSLRTKTKSNFRAGSNDYFIVEADEYMRHFLYFSPNVLVITNIDADHLDYFKDLTDIQSAFRALAAKVPSHKLSKSPSDENVLRGGAIVCDPKDLNVAPILQGLSCTIIDYKKYYDPQLPMRVLPLQRINAASVLAVADILNIDLEAARKALSEFTGTWRRFEYKGETKSGVKVYDDYGHHPKEIAMTLASVREIFPKKNNRQKLIVAFQPHLYSRTKLFLEDFAKCFKDADEVFLAPIFAAREKPDPEISSEILAQKINEQGTICYSFSSLERLRSALQAKSAELDSNDLIIAMGAGELYKIAEQLVR